MTFQEGLYSLVS